MSDYVLVNPAVMTAGKKDDGIRIGESEDNAIVRINTETPVFFFLWFELFGAECWMERILTEEFLPPLGFVLYRTG